MGEHLPGTFDRHQETYEGFGTVDLRVRLLHENLRAARDAVYELSETDLKAAVGAYTKGLGPGVVFRAVFEQLRNPIRRFTRREKLLMILGAIAEWPIVSLYYSRAIPKQLVARGRRRTSWRGRPA